MLKLMNHRLRILLSIFLEQSAKYLKIPSIFVNSNTDFLVSKAKIVPLIKHIEKFIQKIILISIFLKIKNELLLLSANINVLVGKWVVKNSVDNV